jgi:hypothetical protein
VARPGHEELAPPVVRLECLEAARRLLAHHLPRQADDLDRPRSRLDVDTDLAPGREGVERDVARVRDVEAQGRRRVELGLAASLRDEVEGGRIAVEVEREERAQDASRPGPTVLVGLPEEPGRALPLVRRQRFGHALAAGREVGPPDVDDAVSEPRPRRRMRPRRLRLHPAPRRRNRPRAARRHPLCPGDRGRTTGDLAPRRFAHGLLQNVDGLVHTGKPGSQASNTR